MADDFSIANGLFVDEEYEQALVHYNSAIETEKERADYYVKRSFCQYKLKNYTEAVGDATTAITLDSSIPIAHQRKGMACFALEEYEAAKEAFQIAEKLNSTPQLKTWIRKCEAELEDEDEDDDEDDEEHKQPQQPTPAPTPTPTPTPTPIPTPTPTSTAPAPKKYRHDWYQSEKKITIEIFIKKVKKDQAEIEIQENELSIAIKLSEHEEFQLSLEFFGPVNPANSKVEFLSTKIEISIEKKNAGSWPDLEKKEVEQVKSIDTEDTGKPGSFNKKNWDAILAEEPEEKLEGDQALNKVFQDIFANGSDEQKKAMVKSFTESGGTVLSTNWQDVGSREVKGSPPKGLEMKTWKDAELGR
uniref:Uncharacterized protein n=1 Tax=Paramoeba aestuarina TaxID=180227 RepID=A0A7S4P9W4_9EUKA